MECEIYFHFNILSYFKSLLLFNKQKLLAYHVLLNTCYSFDTLGYFEP